MKARLLNMAKSTRKRELHPLGWGLSARALLRDGRQANVNFTLSSYNKNQLIDSNSYVNQKVITATNTLDGSTLIDNLIASHQNGKSILQQYLR